MFFYRLVVSALKKIAFDFRKTKKRCWNEFSM